MEFGIGIEIQQAGAPATSRSSRIITVAGMFHFNEAYVPSLLYLGFFFIGQLSAAELK
jgi:hypothetical protein